MNLRYKEGYAEGKIIGEYRATYDVINRCGSDIFGKKEFAQVRKKVKRLSYFEIKIVMNLVVEFLVLQSKNKDKKEDINEKVLEIQQKIIAITG